MNYQIIFFGLYLLVAPSAAFAYLDPGSGSMLLYFIMGIFASLIYYFKGLAYKVRAFFTGSKIDKDLSNLEGIDILFHSEGGQYWNVFLPIIEELEKQGIKSAYYTQKQDDPGLVTDFKHLKAAYIGNDLSSYALLNNIKVKLFVSTTPQLDVMQWRRSKNIENYIHVIHAPTDALMYRYYSFDFYDTVLCASDYQIESIRMLEQARKSQPKELLATGLTYFDILERNKINNLAAKNSEIKTILLAPTWKPNNLFEKYGSQLVNELTAKGYQVILRPHPQAFIHTPDLMAELEQNLANNKLVTFDKNPSGEQSMQQADLLLSDMSGIIFDFYFVYQKPVIAVKGNISIAGQEAESVSKLPWEFENIEKLATLVELNDLEKLIDVIESTLANTEQSQRLKTEEVLFNYGKAGLVAAEQLLEKVRN